MDSLSIFFFQSEGPQPLWKLFALSTSLSLPLIHCWISLCLWRHPQATLRIARRCFLASHLSCKQFISSSQKCFIKPENISTSVICHTLASIKKYLWTHTGIHLYGILKVRTQGCVRSMAFCLSTFAILVTSVGDIICPTRSLIRIPRYPPPVSLRAGWHQVSYSTPDGALSETNEWKTPATPASSTPSISVICRGMFNKQNQVSMTGTEQAMAGSYKWRFDGLSGRSLAYLHFSRRWGACLWD